MSPVPQSPPPATPPKVGPLHPVILHHFALSSQFFSHCEIILCVFFTLGLSSPLECELHTEVVCLVHCFTFSALHSGWGIKAFSKYLLSKCMVWVGNLGLLMFFWNTYSQVSLIHLLVNSSGSGIEHIWISMLVCLQLAVCRWWSLLASLFFSWPICKIAAIVPILQGCFGHYTGWCIKWESI